jgi:hypothetical protein
MRFETKYDTWLVIVLGLASTLTCVVLPVVRIVAPGSHPGPLWLTLMPVVLWLIVITCTLPQYYELRANGLFIRQGWKKSLIPYASLVELQPVSDSRSAGVFSTDRILLSTLAGRQFVIAVEQEARFIAEVSKRCPQLERRPSGFGIALSPPSVV